MSENPFLAYFLGGSGTPAPPSPFDPRREAQFRSWYANRAKALGLDPDPDNPEHHYDYRAAFEAGDEPGPDGHWPSQYKAADHPNRFTEGIDSITGEANPFSTYFDRQREQRAAMAAGDVQARELGLVDGPVKDVSAGEVALEAGKRGADAAAGWMVGLAERAKPLADTSLGRAAVGPIGSRILDAIEPGTRRAMTESLEAKKQELLDRAVAHGGGGGTALALGTGEVVGGAAGSLIPGTAIGRTISNAAKVEQIANPFLRVLASGGAAAAEGAVQGFGDTAGLDPDGQIRGTALSAALGGLPGVGAALPAGRFNPSLRRAGGAAAAVPGPIPVSPEPSPLASGPFEVPKPVAALELPKAPEIQGKLGKAFTPAGEEVPFRWVVRDIDSIETSHDTNLSLNPLYPADAQPRDRSRIASQSQIQTIANNHNPELLAASPSTADGAPLIVRQGDGNPFVVSGNGRTIASRLALDEPHKAERYWQSLMEKADEVGIPADVLQDARAAGMKRPFLVREVIGDVDPVKLAQDSNAPTAATMSATEQARMDARRLSNDLLDQFQPNEAGDVASVTNGAFVRSFMAEVVTPAEAGRMVDAEGKLSQEGVRRVEGALFAAAYDDADAVAKVLESSDSNVRNIGRALLAEAPRIAQTKASIAAGELHPLDVSSDVAAAMRKLSDLRAKGQKVPDYLTQQNLFNAELSPESLELLRIFDENKRSTSRVASILRRYTDLVQGQGDPRQAGLFGGGEIPPKLQLIAEAERTFHQVDELSLFTGGPTADSMKLIGPNLSMLDGIAASADNAKAGAGAVKRAWTKYMASHGKVADLGDGTAQWTANRMRLSKAEQAMHEERAAMDIRDFTGLFDSYIKGLQKDGINRSAEDVLGYLTDGMEGKNDLRAVPPEIREVVGRMRAHVDELTGGLLDNAALTKELRHTLDQNTGKYLRRTFEVHRDPEAWEKVVRGEERWRWDGMQKFVEEEHPDWQPNQVENFMLDMLRRNPEAFAQAGPRTDALRMDRSIFAMRKRQHIVAFEDGAEKAYPSKEMADRAAQRSRELGRTVSVREEVGLPDPVEQFLGLHEDPRARYSESVARMAHDVAVSKFWGDLKGRGENSIFFDEANAPAGYSATVPGDPRFNPLAGMRTTPEIAKVVELIANPTREAPSMVAKAFAATGAAWRAGKTIWSPLTHVRNTLSWVPLLVANGHFTSAIRIPTIARSAKVALAPRLSPQGRTLRVINRVADGIETIGGHRLSEAVRIDLPSLRAEYLEAVRLGIVGEGVRGQEMARYLGMIHLDEKPKSFAGSLAKQLPASATRKAVEFVGNVPEVFRRAYSMEDDVGKLLAWQAEQANYAEALFGTKLRELSPEKRKTVREMTAPLVADLYPTYSKANAVIRGLQKIPVIADFPTYSAEVIRVTKNTLTRSWTELHSDNAKVKMIGAKRLAGVVGMVAVAPAAFKAFARAKVGVSKEEEEAVREFLPPWKTNADTVIIGKKGDGKYSVLDVSFVNPHAILREPVMAFLSRGDGDTRDFEERAIEAMSEFAQPFLQVSMQADAAIDLVRNKTRDGREVYPEFGDVDDQVKAIAQHLTRRAEPGWVSLGREIRAGATEEVNPRTGRPADLRATGVSLATGTRSIEVDVERELTYDAGSYRKALANIQATANSAKKRLGPSAGLDAERIAIESKQKATEEMERKVRQAVAAGLTRRQIWWVLRGGQDGGLLSKEAVSALLRGVE